MNNDKKSLKAFTIMELMIAMIVMSLTFMVTAPAITKKIKASKKPHGSWECMLNDQGVHISVLTNDSGQKETKLEGQYCEFPPQPSANKYLVTVVGAGGGGATGTSFTYDAISFGEPVGFKIESKGVYDLLVIGGGGGGSASIGTWGAIGGSAGEVQIRKDVTLNPGYYVLSAGKGGGAGGLAKESAKDSEDGEENGDLAEECKPKYLTDTNWKVICEGANGSESSIYNENRTFELKARGGYGAGKDIYSRTEENSGAGSLGGLPGFDSKPELGCVTRASHAPFDASTSKWIAGGYISTSSVICKDALDAIGSNLSYIGKGGDGAFSEKAFPGYNGIALIRSALFYSGGAGKTGGIAFSVIKDIEEPVKVIVGKGGDGAKVENTNGMPGENSSFGYYLTAKGGNGGEIKALSSTDKNKKLEGEVSAPSPFGAKNYARGGNGGFAYSSKNTNASIKWGEAEKGYPGYVRVEWN